MKNNEKSMEKIINLCKKRGFIFQGSEIYGGLANTWDYGFLGAALKNNIKNMWIKKFVQENHFNFLIDSAILMNPRVWEASGHLSGFSDPLMDCRSCKRRYRADKLIEEKINNPVVMNINQMENFISEKKIKCPDCGESNFTPIRQFNLMFKTFQGVTENNTDKIYLRPETAQGIFVNFNNVYRCARKKIPFGIAQSGKSFRNEITPGNFLFRTREFEQMELEFFCKPGTDSDWFDYWKNFCFDWLKSLNLKEENIRLRDHEKDELSHYSKQTTDIEFLFPFGWGELWGIANRGSFDLSQHQEFSGKSMEYFDPDTNEKYIPFVIEPSVGLDRALLAFICDAYDEEKSTKENEESRVVLRLSPKISPIKVCVMPLSKKLGTSAFKIYENLMKKMSSEYDDSGSIGRRYRRQDEIGTPWCVTYDFESENDKKVTVRERDSMKQERIGIESLGSYFSDLIG
jgi:glycyl-tRNA synthetase